MKINKIILNNFGSYEGNTSFETKTNDNRNIILIGGKNGAGKTTLFTAMRVCLYGYKSMGYKNYNSYYTRAIIKMLNNSAKLLKPTQASISLELALNNGQGIDLYLIKRSWILTETLTEKFEVIKNQIDLSEEEIADFEKYLLSLIPPELFNLYFFDGEKIADFFLEEGSSFRIKEAFLTLCGYDTFDIMRKNFKRISDNSGQKISSLTNYIEAKEKLEETRKNVIEIERKIKNCADEIYNCELLIVALEKDYHEKGGITEEEWNNKIFSLKEEERKREEYNTLLKKWANDVVPFIILEDEIIELKKQIDIENQILKYNNFCEVINNEKISKMLDNVEEIKKQAFLIFGNNNPAYLNFSLEQNLLVTNQINNILSFEKKKILRYKKAIKNSINLSAKIRKELDKSSISTVQEYMKTKAKLFEEKSALLVMRVELEEKLKLYQEELIKCENNFSKIQEKVEEELKQASINDISARAIIMLDKLQNTLYRKQISKVENNFKENINILIRKTHFIDDIFIDDSFNVHIYRNQNIELSKLIEILAKNSEEQIVSTIGVKAVQILYDLTKANNLSRIVDILKNSEEETIILPVEIDKSSLSNGEKQIFIMTLYYALINLCKHGIPFIIDTPFARIDTDHRRNISKYFFSRLKGQLFILSTNEEINALHLKILEDKISATYMLENLDNKKTIVEKNTYFEG